MKPRVDLRASVLDIRESLAALNQEAKGGYPKDWGENLEHLSGRLITSTQGALKAATSGEYSEQLGSDGSYGTITVANRIGPSFNRLVARALGMVNGFQLTPATNDENDKDAAKGGEKLAAAQWYSEGIYQHIIEALAYTVTTGHGFSLNEGDSTLEEPQQVGDQSVPCGRVVRRIIPPQCLDVMAGIRRFEDTSIAIAHMGYTAEEVARRWGTVPEDAPAFNYDTAEKLNGLEPALGEQLIKIDRVWFAPDRKLWPKGKAYVLCGDTVLWESLDWIGVGDPSQPRTCQIPIVDFCDIPCGVGFWGRGRQTIARGPQKILNVAWSKCSQVAALPGLIIGLPRGSQLNASKINNAPVSIVNFNPAGGHGVTFWTPPRMQMHEYVIQMCQQWIDEAFSQPPPSRGQSPGSRFPSSGLQLLMEQAELGDTPFGKLIMDSISKLMRLTLIEGKRVWPESMVDYILGSNGRYERIEFRKAELADGWDIRVLPDTGLPQSKGARIDAVAKLGQTGMLGNLQMDPKAQQKSRKLARVFTEDDAFDPEKADENNAKDEERLFQKGQSLTIQEYDDDETHVRIHLAAAKERGHMIRDPEQFPNYPTEEQARLAHIQGHMDRANPPSPEGAMPPEGIPPEQAPPPAMPGEASPEMTEGEALQQAMQEGGEDEFIDENPVPGEEPAYG